MCSSICRVMISLLLAIGVCCSPCIVSGDVLAPPSAYKKSDRKIPTWKDISAMPDEKRSGLAMDLRKYEKVEALGLSVYEDKAAEVLEALADQPDIFWAKIFLDVVHVRHDKEGPVHTAHTFDALVLIHREVARKVFLVSLDSDQWPLFRLIYALVPDREDLRTILSTISPAQRNSRYQEIYDILIPEPQELVSLVLKVYTWYRLENQVSPSTQELLQMITTVGREGGMLRGIRINQEMMVHAIRNINRLYHKDILLADFAHGYSPERIKAWREARLMTHEDLGKLVGKKKTAILRYEQGKITPPTETLVKMAYLFGVDPMHLMGSDAIGVRLPAFDRVRLVTAREARGYSMTQLTEKIKESGQKVSQHLIRDSENGKTAPGPGDRAIVEAIAAEPGVTLDYFMGLKEHEFLPFFLDIHAPGVTHVGTLPPINFPVYQIGSGEKVRKVFLKNRQRDWRLQLKERLAYAFADRLGVKNISRVQITRDSNNLYAAIEVKEDAGSSAFTNEMGDVIQANKLYELHLALGDSYWLDYAKWLPLISDPVALMESDLFRYFFSIRDSYEPKNWMAWKEGEKWGVRCVNFEHALIEMPIRDDFVREAVHRNKGFIAQYGMRFMESAAGLTDEAIEELVEGVYSKDILSIVQAHWYTFQSYKAKLVSKLKQQRDLFRELHQSIKGLTLPSREEPVPSEDPFGMAA